MKDGIQARMTYYIVIEYVNIDIYNYGHETFIFHGVGVRRYGIFTWT